MDFTQRMLRLLGDVRRERNGGVEASMRYSGAAYGLNYGVSLPTLRTMARAEESDHEFAKYLYQQDIRELRLAALHIADPARLCEAEFSLWAGGIINSEVAEEAAFALFSAADALPALFGAWIVSDEELLRYTALLAGARFSCLTDVFIAPALVALRRNPDDLLTARGVVALLAVLAEKKEYRQAVIRVADTLGNLPAEDFVHEEIAWRLKS